MTCTPPWSRYRTWNSLVSSGASSTKSVAERRVSNVFPVTRFRSRTWTNARRLPGVRCVKSITRHGCPESRMTCPRLMSVAFIERLPEMETARATRWPTRPGRKINGTAAGSTGSRRTAARRRALSRRATWWRWRSERAACRGIRWRRRPGERQRAGEVSGELPLPPVAAPRPLRRGAEAVAVVGEPQIARRAIGERILTQQREHVRRSREEMTRQGREPAPRAFRVQRGEPHLPIEPRHVRLREPRAAGEGARLPTELVFLPGHPVPAAFDHDLRPLGRHHPEQPVAVDRAQRRHGAEQRVVEGTAPAGQGGGDLPDERQRGQE